DRIRYGERKVDVGRGSYGGPLQLDHRSSSAQQSEAMPAKRRFDVNIVDAVEFGERLLSDRAALAHLCMVKDTEPRVAFAYVAFFRSSVSALDWRIFVVHWRRQPIVDFDPNLQLTIDEVAKLPSVL